MCSYRTQTCLIFSDTNAVCIELYYLARLKTLAEALSPKAAKMKKYSSQEPNILLDQTKTVLVPGNMGLDPPKPGGAGDFL